MQPQILTGHFISFHIPLDHLFAIALKQMRCFFLLLAVALAGASPHAALPPEVAAAFHNISMDGVVRIREGSAANVVAGANFGHLDRRKFQPIDETAQFPMGSNTKLHVALALYQLQERGKVNLSDSVATYLDASDFANFGVPALRRYCPTLNGSTACETVTFEQLLAMSAGLPGGPFINFLLPYPGSIGLAFGQTIALPLLFAPGSGFFYSNPSFILAAYFVEKFSGQSLSDYLAANVWGPAGMRTVSYDPYRQQLSGNPARVDEGYKFVAPPAPGAAPGAPFAEGVCSFELDDGQVNGAGGFVGTVEDEAKLYFQLFDFQRMGRPFLNNPASLLAMVRPRTQAPGTPRWFGQGVWVMKAANESAWTKPYPPFIFYEGETLCSHTANFFDVSVDGAPLLTQAWKKAQVFFVDPAVYRAAVAAKEGNFFDVTAAWATPTPLHVAAWTAHNHYRPPPPGM